MLTGETNTTGITHMASDNFELQAHLGVRIAAMATMVFSSLPAIADDPAGNASYAKIPASAFLPYSCEELWFMRNDIYNMRGYCFTTPKAKATFKNSDCVSTKPHIINSFERHNVAVIEQVERQKGCR